MQWCNILFCYGVFSLFLYWGSVLVVFGLFGLGLWMCELSYYDFWYYFVLVLYKSIGILLVIVLLVWIVWCFVSLLLLVLVNYGLFMWVVSKFGYFVLYGLLLVVIVVGYLIFIVDGELISVFGWFFVLVIFSGLFDQVDVVGEIYFYLVWVLVVFVVFYVLVVFKYYFVDCDLILKCMFGCLLND